MVRLRLLPMLVLLLVGCGPVRQTVFSLLQDERPDAPTSLDGGMDAAAQDAAMDAGPADAGMDAGLDAGLDAGAEVDAGPPDAGPPGCPEGAYIGEFMCDFGGDSLLVVGKVDFTIDALDPVTRRASLSNGWTRGYVPVSSDDLTPFAELAPVEIRGDVTCIPGAPPQLSAQSAEISLIGVDVLPPPVILTIGASAMDGSLFVGRYSVSGGAAWECFGMFSAAPNPDADPDGNPLLPMP